MTSRSRTGIVRLRDEQDYAHATLCRRASVHRCIIHGVAGVDVTGALVDVSMGDGVLDGVGVPEGVALGV
jgi:hypothetical protein